MKSFLTIFAVQMEKSFDMKVQKEPILREAFLLFKSKGVVPVKMDDIASRMSMSKRTLYEIFKNKENLILECVIAHQKWNVTLFETESNSEQNVLRQAFEFLHLVMMDYNNTSHRFFEDLKKYPKVQAYIDCVRAEGAVNGKKWLEKGVEQGLFREDVRMDLVVSSVNIISQSLSSRKESGGYSVKTLLNSIIMVILRGIVTSKGLLVLSMLEKKYFTNEEI